MADEDTITSGSIETIGPFRFDHSARQITMDVWMASGTETYTESYDALLEFELLKDEEVISKGGVKSTLGGAAIGSLLFGSTGAIVGALAGQEKRHGPKNPWRCLFIQVAFHGTEPRIYKVSLIPFGAVRESSSEFERAVILGKAIVAQLQEIADDPARSVIGRVHPATAPTTPAEAAPAPVVSHFLVADELIKLKGLLDEGVLAQEEFDTQKKRLLNM